MSAQNRNWTGRAITDADVKDQYVLGSLGESSVAGWYEEMGCEVLDLRYRTSAGEIDVIVEEPDGTIVFVEVKTRRGTSFGAVEAVTARKVRRMRAAAASWLEGKPMRPVRFDVVEVLFDGVEVTSRMYQGVDDGAC